MKKRIIIFVSALILLAAGLLAILLRKEEVRVSETTIPYVREVLSDESLHEHGVLFSALEPPVGGDIVIVGCNQTARCVQDAFAAFDSFDNIDGRFVPDGLPDFSGERIVCIRDDFHSPYHLQALRDQEAFRKTGVEMLLHSLDSLYSVSQYDVIGRGRKPSAKAIIYSDPEIDRHVRIDIDTLISASGCTVPVFTPLTSVSARIPEGSNVGVICRTSEYGTDLYPSIWPDCTVFPSDTLNPLTSYLDRYVEAGALSALDVLVVADEGVDLERLQAELDAANDMNRLEYLDYNHLLSADFKVIVPSEAMAADCYRALRGRDLFAHRIHYPEKKSYVTVRRPRTDDGSYIVIPDIYVQN